MKESRHDIRPTESPEVRKRRLARERQRRHREKVRAKLRAQTNAASSNHDAPISTPARTSHFQHEHGKRQDDDPIVAADRDGLQRKSFSQRDAYMDAPDLHSPLDVRDRTSSLLPPNSSRGLKRSSVHGQKPASEKLSGVTGRAERPFASKPSLQSDKRDHEDKRLSSGGRAQSATPHKSNERQQHLHQPHQRRQHQSQQNRNHRPSSLHQHQQQRQESRVGTQHRPSDADHSSQVPLLDQQRDNHTRDQDREKAVHRDQQQAPTQRHEYVRHDVLHQQAQFPSNTHGYSADVHQQHASQSQHHHDPAFAFPQADVAVSQQTYVTDPHRQYVSDGGMPLGVATRTYPRFGMQGRSPLSNAASGFAPVQGGGQSLQNNLGAGASSAVNVGVHGGLGLNRDSGITKYRQRGGNAVTGGQHAASPISDGRDPTGTVEAYTHNRIETPEERKRRLARERQRRRRKRLKQDTTSDAKVEGGNMHRSQHEVTRDALGGPGGVASTIDLPMHVRAPESNMQTQPSGGMHAGMPNFESPNLASNHPLSGGVHGLQVGGAQEDLGGPGPGRAGFTTHALGVPGTNSATAAAPGVLGHPNVGELHRLHPHPEEKVSRAQFHEDPDARKRRLARDRQRRRRERLKSKKISVGDPGGANVSDLKGAGTATGKLGEGADPRVTSDSERRVVPSEGLGETDRIPLGSAGSPVFGTRADVAHSLTFGDHGRNMRGPSVPDGAVSGMPIGIPTGSMMNVSNVPVNAFTLQLQNMVHWSQGFESESSAKFAVDSAISELQRQLPSNNPGARSYVIQQSIITLLGNDDACRDLLNGPSIPSLRPDTVMRM